MNAEEPGTGAAAQTSQSAAPAAGMALEAAGLGLWEWNVPQQVMLADSGMRSVLGLSPEVRLNAENFKILVGPQQFDRMHLAFALAMARPGNERMEFSLVISSAGGEENTVRIRGKAVFGSDGSFRRLTGVGWVLSEAEKGVVDTIIPGLSQIASLLDHSPVAIATIAREQRCFTSANPLFCDLIGRQRTEILGHSFREVLADWRSEGLEERLTDVLDTGIAFVAREMAVHILKSGKREQAYINFVLHPMAAEGGKISTVFFVITDVTSQVLARHQLESSERRFQHLVRNAAVGITLLTGDDLQVELANNAYATLIGHSVEEILHRPIFAVLPTAEAFFRPVIEKVRLTGEERSLQNVPFRVFSGSDTAQDRFINVSYQPYRDESEIIVGVIAVVQDITDQVSARKIVEESEANLAAAINLAELATWKIDVAAQQMFFSPRFFDWVGTASTEWNIGMAPFVHAEDHDRIAGAVADTISGQVREFDQVYRIVNPASARIRIIHANGRPRFNAQGEVMIIEGTAQDVTIQKQLQSALEEQVDSRTQQLAEANQELVRSNEELAQFAYVATHDLQEPLRKIRFYSGNLMRDHLIPAAAVQPFQVIERSAERMSFLIRDLLDFSRLLNYDGLYKPVDLDLVVREVISDYDMLIQEKGMQFEITGLPTVNAVRFQMQQLFYNLLGNSLKFSRAEPSPRIRITCKMEKENGSDKYHITVSDNGIGFSQEYATRIFEVFKRLHNRHVYAGNGIGLAVCKKIVENHHGRIYAEGVENEGAVFHLFFPAPDG